MIITKRMLRVAIQRASTYPPGFGYQWGTHLDFDETENVYDAACLIHEKPGRKRYG